MRLEIYLFESKYHEPFTISLGTSTSTSNVIVRLLSEGLEGWGEASPSPRILGDNIEEAVNTVEKLFKLLRDAKDLTPEIVYEKLKSVPGSPSGKAGFEMAFMDLWSKSIGSPLCKILGGYRRTIETDITIGIVDPEEQAKRALRYVEKGFRALKIKLGLNPELDIRRVKAVRDAVGEGIKIRVDANQGWSVEDAIRVINRISGYDVELIEQPVRYDDLEGLASVKKESPIPIVADESVKTPEDAIKVITKEGADVINIKLMKSAGIMGAVRIAYVTEAAGLENMIGCMGESKIGITAAAHVALGLRNIRYYDLDSDMLIVEDPVSYGGITGESERRISGGEGLGIEKVDMGKLKLLKRLS